MRHYFKSDSRPKSVAKSIRAELLKLGFGLSHSDSLLLSAKIYDYRNWADLAANLGKHPPSQDDRDAGDAIKAARLAHHVAVLVDYGLDRQAATAVVEKIGPTSSGVRLLLGREELWVDDEAVAAYLDRLAIHIAGLAVEVRQVRHGTWLGFAASFEPPSSPEGLSSRVVRLRSGGGMLFGVSDDGRSAILRHLEDGAFPEAVDERVHRRRSGSTDDWDFLDVLPGNTDTSQMSEEAMIVGEVFSRLHLPTLRAMRSRGYIDEVDYEKAVSSDRIRSFLHRYPALADHCFWSLSLSRESRHLGSAKWIEGSAPDIALMAMLTDGALPSGEALRKAEGVAEALVGYAITSTGNDTFSSGALAALAHIGPTAIPSSKAEMRYLIRSAEDVDGVLPYGMDMGRAYHGFSGSWKTFFHSIRRGEADGFTDNLRWWTDTFVYLICSAFGQTYGIDPDLLYDKNFSHAVEERIGPVTMARMSMADIAALYAVIKSHKAQVAYHAEERYPSVREADELATLYALPMPDAYHGKSCVEILGQAGYDLDALAGMLKLEPDLTFDSMGLPEMEERFKGVDRSTYAVEPLKTPGYEEPKSQSPRRPAPMSPAKVPEAPAGWVFEGGEFVSTSSFRPSRIRWSDGVREPVGSGPGWYADRGIGMTPEGAKHRCPVRLGRFDTPAAAAQAIVSSKGMRG